MARDEWVQLAARIPKALHRELRVYCVTREIALMDFVVAALEEKLARERRRRRRDQG